MLNPRQIAAVVSVAVLMWSCTDATSRAPRPVTAAGDPCPALPEVSHQTVAAAPDPGTRTRIVIDPADRRGDISPLVYGINHRYPYAGFGSWDPESNEPHALFLDAYRYANFSSLRFPGGRMANPYRWKRAIGPLEDRGRSPNGGTSGQAFSNEFGPDEFGKLLELTESEGTIVANFATGSPREAADWVEYMNSPVGDNPNGGVAWAEVRAENGHPDPYGIRYWEIGNEMNSGMVYWMGEGQSEEQKARKYIFGGETRFEDQNLGTQESWAPDAARATGKKNLVRWVRYPPVHPGTETVFVDGETWRRVDDLAAAGAEDVYEIRHRDGKIAFGDGENGNVPPNGARLAVSYDSGPHAGFLEFYRAMKDVDPSIEIGSAVHTDVFTELMGDTHPYDFMVVHTYGFFEGAPDDPKDLHDYMMLLPDEQADYIEKSQQQILRYAGPDRAAETHVALTEYAAGSGLNRGIHSIDAPEHYLRSLDGALYTALLLRHWVRLGIVLAQKHSLIDTDPETAPEDYTRGHTADSAVIGPAPCFVPSATAGVFRMYTSLLGLEHVGSRVDDNPRRKIFDGSRMSALVTFATIDEDGRPAVLVVNRDREKDVTAQISVADVAALGSATIWTLGADDFSAFNTIEEPDRVAMTETVVEGVEDGLFHTFPRHSVTAIRFAPLR